MWNTEQGEEPSPGTEGGSWKREIGTLSALHGLTSMQHADNDAA